MMEKWALEGESEATSSKFLVSIFDQELNITEDETLQSAKKRQTLTQPSKRRKTDTAPGSTKVMTKWLSRTT